MSHKIDEASFGFISQLSVLSCLYTSDQIKN